jgi:catechol 2,3-dioxygenase-like lactoylglutathione lyase family enzyme
VADARRTVAFYEQVLGFEVDVAWPEEAPTFFILKRDATSLAFFEPDEHRPDTIGYAELYIEVTDATALHAELAGRVPIEWGPEVYAYGRREFALRDPDAYLVIFTEQTDDPPTTAEPGE